MLALNSGSSSLKLGLYRVGSFRTEMLLSGAAELIGEKTANSSHKIRAEPLCFARRYPFPANGKRSYASEDFSPTPKNAGTGRRRASNRAWRTKAPAALSQMIRSYGNLKPRLPSRRCTCHQLSRSSASHKSIFPGFHRWRPRGFAGGRTCPSNLQGIAIGGYPTLRILRPVLRIDRAPACEAAGSYAVAGGVNTVVPVDLHISGCPPTPRQLLEGLLAPLETQCLT
jgi:NADH ubiquinone oxidoreductase, 20 Kd subunit